MNVPEISNMLNNKINEQVHELKYPVLSPDGERDLENERYILHRTKHKTRSI